MKTGSKQFFFEKKNQKTLIRKSSFPFFMGEVSRSDGGGTCPNASIVCQPVGWISEASSSNTQLSQGAQHERQSKTTFLNEASKRLLPVVSVPNGTILLGGFA
jgi:hypothetical protein